MKNRLFAAVMALWAVLAAALPALVSEAAAAGDTSYVFDSANILTEEERLDLEAKARHLADTYPCEVFLVTVDNFQEYTGGSISDAAEWFYYEYDMGYGSGRDCSLLLLSMSNRKFCNLFHGELGNAAFNENGNAEYIESAFRDNFKENDWYGGFFDFLEATEDCLSDALSRLDSPDNRETQETTGDAGAIEIAVVLVVPALIAGIICLILRSGMKPVHRKTEARSYVVPGSQVLRIRDDIYTYTSTVRRKRPSDRSSGGRSGSGSSGFSSNSGSF